MMQAFQNGSEIVVFSELTPLVNLNFWLNHAVKTRNLLFKPNQLFQPLKVGVK
jgi:hypothetical protein